MTLTQRTVLVIANATAVSAFVGVLSLALHTPRVLPGMLVAFVLAAISSALGTRP